MLTLIVLASIISSALGYGVSLLVSNNNGIKKSQAPFALTAIAPKQPGSLAIGGNGNLYIADPARQEILKRLQNGWYRVVAGTGVAGYSGDGGLATHADLDDPASLAIAPNGALYFVQIGRTKGLGGMYNSMIREVAPNGTITTVAGLHPNCAIVPSNSLSMPANSAEFTGASLMIGAGGLLDISTTVCPNTLHLGSFLQLTSSGELVQTPVDSVPKASGYCGGEVAGPGFIAFGCMSGAGRGPRLMVVRSNGSTASYPDIGSQPNLMAASNGTVVAIHNRAIVRVGTNGLETIATSRQVADFVVGATLVMGDNGIAIDRHGNVYVNQDLLVDRRGCADVILEIDPSGRIKELWHSASSRFCY